LETIIMKRYLIPIITVLLVLAMTWAAFGQQERRGGRRATQGRQNLSEEQRAKMRERYQNMSEEEREKFRAEMRQRGGPGRGGFTSPEEQEKAIKTIEEQLVKLKAAQVTRPQGGFQDLSEAERTKLRENMQNRQQALQTIIAQVARMQGRRQPTAGAGAGQFILINTADLKPIQEAAVKEKAKETTQLLQRLIARGTGRGFGGRTGAGQRPQGGQRTPRQRPQGGQGGARQRPQGGQGGRQRNR
jgi:hypothetical protein